MTTKITIDRAAVEQALRALEKTVSTRLEPEQHEKIVAQLSTALAEAEQPAVPPLHAELTCTCGAEWQWMNRRWRLTQEARPSAPPGWKLVPIDALERWRAAFAEELAAWDISPPLQHVLASHDEIAFTINTAPAAPVRHHDDPDGDLQTRYEMLRGWLVEADSSNEILKKHLCAVLEIAHTWEPDYATKMDKETLSIAAETVGHEKPEAPVQKLTTAAHDVLAERQRQISAEGWTTAHDDEHSSGEMAMAASCYAEQGPEPYGVEYPSIPVRWPWDTDWWKPTTYRRNLVKAGALILAEIERLDRTAAAG